jgi:hypothetical protein
MRLPGGGDKQEVLCPEVRKAEGGLPSTIWDPSQHRHCERSEAIQGRKSGGMDCFVGFASSQ